MKIAITDANIFIDLIKLQMLHFLFAIELEITTTLEVFEELHDPQKQELHQFIDNGQLTLHIFSIEEWDEIKTLAKTRGLTMEDLTIAYLAKKMQAVVLSGDNPLRKYCTQQQLEVRGMLWLLDTFLQFKHLTRLQAKEKLIFLLSYNDRLPANECTQRLQQWGRAAD
jgi:hypothetical protein